MSSESSNRFKDIQGAGNVTVDAIIGITDIVESMHHAIISHGGTQGETGQPRTSGITGVVYRAIRGVTKGVGKGLDRSLDQLSVFMEDRESSPGREAVRAALNGVIGDYLMAQGNPLSISMRLRREGKALGDEELADLIQQSRGRLAILVHGSSLSDLHWNREGQDHGAALSRDLGIAPIYLHYNTGLHTSENGKAFSSLLEGLAAQASQPIELIIIGHSMGGLVSRSACHYGSVFGHTWLKNLKKLVFLGTPHHGALLERGGNWVDRLLDTNPYSAPLARLGRIRSSGVTDLRYGNVVEEDWKGHNRFRMSTDTRTPVPLPDGVSCYAIAGTTGKEGKRVRDRLIGDGLVTVASALGRHRNRQLQLAFPESHQWVGREMNHFEMLSHPDVYAMLRQWLTT